YHGQPPARDSSTLALPLCPLIAARREMGRARAGICPAEARLIPGRLARQSRKDLARPEQASDNGPAQAFAIAVWSPAISEPQQEDGVTSSPSPQPQGVDEWLALARGGSPEALGQLLELCRRYLLQVANAELETLLQAKAGASDLVQETFLEAQRVF